MLDVRMRKARCAGDELDGERIAEELAERSFWQERSRCAFLIEAVRQGRSANFMEPGTARRQKLPFQQRRSTADLTPELSRAVKRRRLERIVRARLAHDLTSCK